MKINLPFLSVLLVFPCFFSLGRSYAQTGNWTPANADLSFPRTLLKAAQVPAVQQSISSGERLTLYAGVYGSSNTTEFSDNTTSNGRRARATIAKNAAFVLLLDRKPDAGTVITLPAAERTNLLAKTKTLLEGINTNVEVYASFSGASYTEWQWRSKELIDYMIAYDLLKGAGQTNESLSLARTKLQEFAGNLYKQATTAFLGNAFFNQVKNNHTLMTTSALGLSAVVLNDVGGTDPWLQPTNWINTGLYHLDNVLWRDASRQSDTLVVAGYAEGPYYFKYAFLNCLPFIRAIGNFLPDGRLPYTFNTTTKSIRNPFYDPAYDKLYDWIATIQMPDGRTPALEDSFIDMAMPELALTGKSKYLNPMAFSNFASSQMNSLPRQLSDITVDMRAAFLASNLQYSTPANQKLTALPASGNLVFRSGNDSLASYLHVYGKNGRAQQVTGGHNHGDASSFLLHAKGQLLALDPGYLSNGSRGSVGEGVHHNLILVDGAGPTMGTSGATNDAEGFVQNAVSTGRLSYGEVRTSYLGATITRKTLFVRDSYFLLAEAVSSTSAHTYTWQLHGYGLEGGSAATGTFTDSLAFHSGTWQKNGVNLKAHVTATNGASTYGKAANVHELTYNTTESHTTLQVQKAGVPNVQFLSLLHPYTTRALGVKTVSTAQTAALAMGENEYQDLAFAQADTVAVSLFSLPQTVTADALFTFFSLDKAGEFAQVFMETGKTLTYGSSFYMASSRRATLAWQKLNDLEYEGYASKSTVLTITLDKPPVTVTGANLDQYSYDPVAKEVSITLSGPSAFKVNFTPTPLPVKLTQFTGKRQQNNVLLTWETASEKDNKGFELQRKTAEMPGFETLTFVKGNGTSNVVNRYSFEDATAPTSTVYYRLKQRDHDGNFEFSKVIAVAGSKTAAPHFTVYPIPADEVVNLYYNPSGTPVQMRLSRSDGKVLQQVSFQGEMQLSTALLVPGLYFLHLLDLQGNPLSPVRKLIVKH
ncbi:heparinase II/III family protein [Rufibacter radiotolerans]|uniref:heparinase II/III family protein n=1 Tax=Rufibacter radiotolerans TaxID=1379910 RepID=UPI0006645583|nr:heparinase II/III family protein [Rufibacter radiotolerans]